MSVHAEAQRYETEQFPKGRIESDGSFYEKVIREGKTSRDREGGSTSRREGNRSDRVKRDAGKAGG